MPTEPGFLLYVSHEQKDLGSQKAIQLAQHLPDVMIRNVESLRQIPDWLTILPTCVSMKDKSYFTGSDVIKFLQAQQQQHQQQDVRTAPPHPRRINPTPVQHFPQSQYPEQQVGVINDHANEQFIQGTDTVIRGSLTPASGTGNFGCALDDAFCPIIDESKIPEDPRYRNEGNMDTLMRQYSSIRENQRVRRPTAEQQLEFT